MLTNEAPSPPRPDGTDRSNDVLAVFAVLWAAAALFHVWVNPWAQGVFRQVTLLGVASVLLALVALLVLWKPRSLPALGALAVLGVLTCWLEAPLLGNHWLLAGLISLGLALALVTSVRNGQLDPGLVVARFLPVARWTLVAFYAFAALAKLNDAFLDPKVSCGVFYGDELLRSLHLGSLDPTSAVAPILPVLVIGIELAIPLLLVIRRTRHLGVVVGLVYHGVIAWNMTHLFADFSSVLAPLFILFLPGAFAVDVVALAQRQARRVKAAQIVTIAAAAIVLLALWRGSGDGSRRLFVDGRVVLWLACDVVVLVLVVRFLRRPHPEPAPFVRGGARSAGWLMLVPALAAFNGLTPYLELKTGYGWNMYSNLETVNGASNHLLVPATLRLSNVQADLVRIQATNDPALALYVNQRYDIPFRHLRAYLSGHPGSSLVYDRAGKRHLADPASSDPRLVRPVPTWRQKLQPFRAVDQSRPLRCQPAFLPAH